MANAYLHYLTQRWRWGAFGFVLASPFLYGAAIDDSFEVGGGGGQYYYGICGTVSRVGYGQGFVRRQVPIGGGVSLQGEAGAAHSKDTVVSDTDFKGNAQPENVGKTSTATWLFARPQLRWDTQYLGLGAGALLYANGVEWSGLPAGQVRLGPRVFHIVADGGMGGFSGGFYEGDFLPFPYPPLAGYGMEFDTRYAGNGEGESDGVEFRAEARHALGTFEFGSRVHWHGWRFFAEADWRPGSDHQASAVAGFGFEFGTPVPRSVSVPDVMRFER